MSTTQRRTMSTLVAGLAVAGLAAVTVASPAGADDSSEVKARGPVLAYAAVSPNPLTGVRAKLEAHTTRRGRTIVELELKGFARALQGRTFGAHAHTGPCSATVAAGPHYTQPGTAPLRDRELWLDFTVGDDGEASVEVRRDWAFPSGAAKSVVIHADPTAPTGVAGTRLGCMAVTF